VWRTGRRLRYASCATIARPSCWPCRGCNNDTMPPEGTFMNGCSFTHAASGLYPGSSRSQPRRASVQHAAGTSSSGKKA
jgi:hypothetical protein